MNGKKECYEKERDEGLLYMPTSSGPQLLGDWTYARRVRIRSCVFLKRMEVTCLCHPDRW